METMFDAASALLSSGAPFVMVTLVEASGSTPADAGARMLVTPDGLHAGTVGGGRLEAKALAEARAMLSGDRRTRLVSWNLNKDVGMTCGGSVRLYFETHGHNPWTVAVFGAGHVAQALVRVLAPLDSRVLCFDERAEWLDRLPNAPNVQRQRVDHMASQVAGLPDGAFVVLMTMGHATDAPILVAALRERRFPYIGVIGSRAKAVQLRRDVEAANLPPDTPAEYHCPIGLPIGSNHPGEIAISVAAQLLMERDRRSSP